MARVFLSSWQYYDWVWAAFYYFIKRCTSEAVLMQRLFLKHCHTQLKVFQSKSVCISYQWRFMSLTYYGHGCEFCFPLFTSCILAGWSCFVLFRVLWKNPPCLCSDNYVSTLLPTLLNGLLLEKGTSGSNTSRDLGNYTPASSFFVFSFAHKLHWNRVN